MDEKTSKRVQILARVLFFWALVIVGRLVQLQILQHSEYVQMALSQQERVVEIRAPRGQILDRLGQPLAMSLPVDSVCVNPMRVPDPGVAAAILSKILDLDSSALLLKMKAAIADQRGFMWVKRKITPEESESLRSLKLDWVEFRTESRRFYPYKSLAANVIGSVGFDESGNAGIEQSLNDELAGRAGEMRVATDVRQQGYDSVINEEPQPGRDIKLTIDSRLQYIAERELKNTVTSHHCRTGSAVAMNPYTGEILAMASYPTFDPNEPIGPGNDLASRTNLAVSTPFEPGSVFKVVTVTSALETTNIRPDTVVSCGGGILRMFGRVIHDAPHEHYAALPVEDVLAHSSNIGAINIGLRVGKENLYDYVRRFGFGQRTGLPLPGESAGLVHRLKYWQPGSIASVSMGHEVMVTTVQLARACSVIANGGSLVKPRILEDGAKPELKRVIKPETAITMRRMMEHVVLAGTGKKARLAGYTAGGKTGTAQIVDLRTHTYTHFYNASFMGFAPVTNPALVIVVTVNGASGIDGYGAQASAPAFHDVATAAMRLLDVPKDLPDDVEPVDDGKTNENDVAFAGIDGVPDFTPDDDAQQPAPAQTTVGAPLPTLAQAVLQPVQLTGPRVPDFRGRSKRDVAEQAEELGLPVEYAGTGLARAQYPPPGAVLPPGQNIRVQFER